MSLIVWIIIFSLLGGILSVIAASAFLILKEDFRNRLLPHFVSFAIGALLGTAFLALLPHAMESSQKTDFHLLGLTILLGILGFFLLEKMVLWRHCHSTHCEVHTPAHDHPHDHNHDNKVSGTLVMVGDAIHNMVDGVLIAAAFMTDIDLGIVTAMAVAAHEIPQEVGDFAILLHSGFERGKAFAFNMLASVSTVVGAVIAYFSLQSFENILPYVLAIAASSFIYIAVADLIPGLHKRTRFQETLQQVVLIACGVVVIYLAHSNLH